MIGTSHPTDDGADLVQQWAKTLSAVDQLTVVQSDQEGIDQLALRSVARTRASSLAWICSRSLSDTSVKQKVDFLSSKGLVMSSVLPLKECYEGRGFNSTKDLLLATVKNFVVIQAELRSQSLKLIREAADFGCEVMAVPGPISHPLSKGSHLLIKQGAALVEGTDDIMKILKLKKT